MPAARSPSTSPQDALIAAFDLIKARIAALEDKDTAAPPAAEDTAPPSSSAASDPMPAPVVETVEETSAANEPEAAISMPAEAVWSKGLKPRSWLSEIIEIPEEAAEATAEVADMAAETPDAAPETGDESAEAAEAYDEALLDMVALEMGADDPDRYR